MSAAPQQAARRSYSAPTLPHNDDLEASLLGGVILRNEALALIEDVEVDDFYDQRHKVVFEAVRNLEAAARPIDVVTLEAEIERQGKLDAIGGIAFLGELALRVPTAENVRTYADEVRQLARNRRAILLLTDGLARAYDWPHDPAEMISEIAGDLQRLDMPAQNGPWQAALARARADVRALLAAKRVRRPLFKIDAIDLIVQEFDGARWLVTGLITRGGVAIIGGEPKVAIKTWLATEIVLAIATGSRVFGEFPVETGRCLYFYAEDKDVQARNRLRALLKFLGRRLEPGRLHLQPRGTFIDMLVDDDLAWLVASARELGKFDVIVLDPLRDIHSGEEDKSDSMRDVMRRLRVLAELLDCTVIAVHHASKATKGIERRAGQNLRGSSAIHGATDAGIYMTEPGGNGTNVFTATVTSQVKGAKSAGTFELALHITDDDHGEAIEAEWQLTRFARTPSDRAEKRTTARLDDADRAVLALVERRHAAGDAALCSQRQIRGACGISEGRATAAIERVLHIGRLVKLDITRIEKDRPQRRTIFAPPGCVCATCRPVPVQAPQGELDVETEHPGLHGGGG